MKNITDRFPITEKEYKVLDEKFGKLCHAVAWELIRKNIKSNYTDEESDIVQELRIAILRAGSYYKRQCYVEKCFELCYEYADDKFLLSILNSLKFLWDNKTHHGASKQRFGLYQENILYKLLRKIVPKKVRPFKKQSLVMDNKFIIYCKSIAWNTQRNLGKKITRERSIRVGMVSISEDSIQI